LLYLFDGLALDSDRRELRRGAERLPIEPQVFDLLEFLIRNRYRVVCKDDLIASVWGGRIVSESTLDSRISAVRRAVGDNGREQRLIRTTIGKGIRFVGTLHERPAVGATAPAAPATATLSLPDKPSIAVLPFQNMSNDPEHEYFAHGMAEEIITALSRIRWLSVISRNSSFSYEGRSPDAKLVRRELNVRYILEGSVRRGGNRLRITGQLVDAATGAHLWADRFDGPLEDVFDLQDKVAMSVAAVIEPTLQAAETTRLAGRPIQDLTTYDLLLRAQAMVWSSAWQVPEVLGLMEQVIARDPQCGPALAWAAICCLRLHEDGRSEDREGVAARGIDLARRALEVADDDPTTLANAALTLAYFGEDIAAMMAIVDRSLVLNQSSARCWYISGVLNLWAGHPDIAIQHLQSSMCLSPRARVGNSPHVIGAAHFFARRFDEAVPRLLLAMQEDPGYAQPYRYLAAYYAQAGRLDAAREVIARLRSVTPVLMPPSSPLRNADDRRLFLSGLRLAMGQSQ